MNSNKETVVGLPLCEVLVGTQSDIDLMEGPYRHTVMLEKDEFERCREQLATYKTVHALCRTADEMAMYTSACSQPMTIRKEEVKQQIGDTLRPVVAVAPRVQKKVVSLIIGKPRA